MMRRTDASARFLRCAGGLLLSLSLLASIPELAFSWAETDDKDFIIDAPWRTVRAYVPMLFLAPESQRWQIADISVYNIDRRGANRELIFRDRGVYDSDRHSGERHQQYLNCRTSDGYRPVVFIDPNGDSRRDVDAKERIDDFWHYIARVPTACIGYGTARGKRGAHLVRAEFHVIRRDHDLHGYDRDVITKVLRIVVTDKPLPRFSPGDRYYDAHFHSIAEQTTRGVGATNRHEKVDHARKAFGGPLAMLVESAYAIGMVDVQLRNGNWGAFRNRIITTDHNVFLSRKPFDDPSAPGFGPTARTDGTRGEFRWYRGNFGDLAGQELTLAEFQGDRVSAFDRGGHHYLFYGGPHFEGPWHGGHLRIDVNNWFDPESKLDNPNSLARVHARAPEGAFGYAAHPFSSTYNWPEPLMDRAIGWPPFNSRKGPLLLAQGKRDFVFKGLEFWNEDHAWVSRRVLLDGRHDIDEMEHLDPFTGRDVMQVKEPNPARYRNLRDGLKRYQALIRRGLDYSFKETPNIKFIRKLFMVAGSDAHGDFNYLTSSSGTIKSEAGDLADALADVGDPIGTAGIDDHAKVTGNAFGRLRTYTLTSEKLNKVKRTGSALTNQLGNQPVKMLLRRSTRKPGNTKYLTNVTAKMKISVAPSNGNGSGSTSSAKPAGSAISVRTSNPVTTGEAYVEGISITDEQARENAELTAAFNAYRDGNTVMTNNPICKFSIDTQCRLDSAKGAIGWHDGSCGWENTDGLIGGHGDFDGGNTGLYVKDRNAGWISTLWKDTAGYFPNLPAAEMRYELVQVTMAGNTLFRLLNKRKGRAKREPIFMPLGNVPLPQAFMLVGDAVGYDRDGDAVSRGMCVTNPVWLAPVEIEIQHPDKCPMAPGSVTAVFKFATSMTADAGTRVFISPLNGAGNATAPLELKHDYRWSRYNERIDLPKLRGVRRIARGMLSAKNAEEIPCPAAGWDAERHKATAAPGSSGAKLRGYSQSYAVVATNLRDIFGNPLNDVGTTLTLKTNGIVSVDPGTMPTKVLRATPHSSSEPTSGPKPEPTPKPKPRSYPKDPPKMKMKIPGLPPKPRPDTRGS